MPLDEQKVEIPPGFCCITTYGPIRHETAQCLLEARSLNERSGLTNIAYSMIPSTLVEKARNEAVRQMLRAKAGWIFFIDGDTTFEANAILRIVQTAFGEVPQADAVGAWVPLRGELALPTTDFGSGTWESCFPGGGTREVIRTGGAFLLAKRHIFESLRDPWFRMRVPSRAADFLLEVDNLARCKFDGENPFRGLPNAPWEKLERIAADDPSAVAEQFVPVEVGEDSGWCDRVRNAGYHIFVNTDVACGHVDTKIVTWQDHKMALAKIDQLNLQCVGVWA